MTAASKQPARSPAVAAAENAMEPGTQRPEERVVPQISVSLRSKNVSAAPTTAAAASAPLGSVPGAVNDGVARCLAASSARGQAACKRALAASRPADLQR